MWPDHAGGAPVIITGTDTCTGATLLANLRWNNSNQFLRSTMTNTITARTAHCTGPGTVTCVIITSGGTGIREQAYSYVPP